MPIRDGREYRGQQEATANMLGAAAPTMQGAYLHVPRGAERQDGEEPQLLDCQAAAAACHIREEARTGDEAMNRKQKLAFKEGELFRIKGILFEAVFREESRDEHEGWVMFQITEKGIPRSRP